MKKLNVAVVGVGNIGKKHAKIYDEFEETHLKAVCDIDKNKADSVAE